MTTDRDGNRSNPYHPNAGQCCEACVFNARVPHAKFCVHYVDPVELADTLALWSDLRNAPVKRII